MKLNIGSSSRLIEGFINIDIDGGDMYLDCGKEELPFDNNSVDLIVSSHFIEHLTQRGGSFFLSECDRVLRCGGVMVFGWPCLRKMAKLGKPGVVYNTGRLPSPRNISLSREVIDDMTDVELKNVFFEGVDMGDNPMFHKSGYTVDLLFDEICLWGDYEIIEDEQYDKLVQPIGRCGVILRVRKM